MCTYLATRFCVTMLLTSLSKIFSLACLHYCHGKNKTFRYNWCIISLAVVYGQLADNLGDTLSGNVCPVIFIVRKRKIGIFSSSQIGILESNSNYRSLQWIMAALLIWHRKWFQLFTKFQGYGYLAINQYPTYEQVAESSNWASLAEYTTHDHIRFYQTIFVSKSLLVDANCFKHL